MINCGSSPVTHAAVPPLADIHPPFGRVISGTLHLLGSNPSDPTRVSLTPRLVIHRSAGCRH